MSFLRCLAGGLCSLPKLWAGEPLAPFRRNGEQGGGAFPHNAAALEVTPPQAESLGTKEKIS